MWICNKYVVYPEFALIIVIFGTHLLRKSIRQINDQIHAWIYQSSLMQKRKTHSQNSQFVYDIQFSNSEFFSYIVDLANMQIMLAALRDDTTWKHFLTWMADRDTKWDMTVYNKLIKANIIRKHINTLEIASPFVEKLIRYMLRRKEISPIILPVHNNTKEIDFVTLVSNVVKNMDRATLVSAEKKVNMNSR